MEILRSMKQIELHQIKIINIEILGITPLITGREDKVTVVIQVDKGIREISDKMTFGIKITIQDRDLREIPRITPHITDIIDQGVIQQDINSVEPPVFLN